MNVGDPRVSFSQYESYSFLQDEVRLRPKTDPHDRSIKVNHAKEFLGKGR